MRQHTYGYGRSRYEDPPPIAVRAGAVLALGGAILLFAAPVLYRVGLLSLRVAAGQVFVWGAYLGGVAALLSLVGLVIALRRHVGRRGVGRAVLAIIVGAVAFRAGGRIPFRTQDASLADVTTDTSNPPKYVALTQAGGATGAPAYAGEPLAARQRQAYPDIAPLVLTAPKDEVFARTVATVRNLGWTLIAADGPAGRIEASARTRLFGTTDDVVVRVVEAADGGSRVDVRSVAREGSDAGGSAATRVRAVLRALSRS